ncbi:hypothetical protein [Streptomyces sp. TS71-3]|uniref:effector-associated constant component EACC1 n=1 Tax=Streptomyces sp. TS71-3 TaxID=2733862 RepID=UPI001B2D5442|nr:hypothetical protein [Streptomyces sp. TS71-3]GHJ38875.1 hypothetical protein Sm713_44840 [Streptomyces sp. TS71-3]
MTEIVVRVAGPSPEEDTEDALRSLLLWVRQDENVPAGVRGRIAAGEEPPAGSMGAVLDLVEFAVGSGISAAALVVSVLQWRDGRRRAPAVILRRGEVEVLLPEGLANDTAALTRIVAVLDGEDPPAPAAARDTADGPPLVEPPAQPAGTPAQDGAVDGRTP